MKTTGDGDGDGDGNGNGNGDGDGNGNGNGNVQESDRSQACECASRVSGSQDTWQAQWSGHATYRRPRTRTSHDERQAHRDRP